MTWGFKNACSKDVHKSTSHALVHQLSPHIDAIRSSHLPSGCPTRRCGTHRKNGRHCRIRFDQRLSRIRAVLPAKRHFFRLLSATQSSKPRSAKRSSASLVERDTYSTHSSFDSRTHANMRRNIRLCATCSLRSISCVSVQHAAAYSATGVTTASKSSAFIAKEYALEQKTALNLAKAAHAHLKRFSSSLL